MIPEDMQNFALDLLNTPELRDILTQVDGIAKLEQLVDLRDLTLTDLFVSSGVKDRAFVAYYECTASPDLYLNPNEELINHEVIKQSNILASGIKHKDQPGEFKYLDLVWSEKQIKVKLKLYNDPKYIK